MADEKHDLHEEYERLAAEKKAAFQRSQAKVIAEHKVGDDDTLSHIALKYYGHATKEYWMLIYEFNKDVIGDNPGIIRPGTMLKVPELPVEMKK
jgi:nucleoid-associated protein YgaU